MKPSPRPAVPKEAEAPSIDKHTIVVQRQGPPPPPPPPPPRPQSRISTDLKKASKKGLKKTAKKISKKGVKTTSKKSSTRKSKPKRR